VEVRGVPLSYVQIGPSNGPSGPPALDGATRAEVGFNASQRKEAPERGVRRQPEPFRVKLSPQPPNRVPSRPLASGEVRLRPRRSDPPDAARRVPAILREPQVSVGPRRDSLQCLTHVGGAREKLGRRGRGGCRRPGRECEDQHRGERCPQIASSPFDPNCGPEPHADPFVSVDPRFAARLWWKPCRIVRPADSHP
jgi:hypothetical protein